MSKTIKEMTMISTFGELKAAGYESRSIKEELRENLIMKLANGEPTFEGIIGFENTVIPALERAILARHTFNLLGLRGQAKTRIARSLTSLLDEHMPVVEGSPLNDDPFNPVSQYAIQVIAERGDDTPIAWMHRSERYVEKLATPDVSVADLIGDIDPIKAANLKLDFSDHRVIHFGLVPRSNRCIFVINELPDLQPRIQVSLFNILQEGDVQIRGFQLRFPLDIQFVFTANPEDYTNRGAIITPLKDRIQSQIITHYPSNLELSKEITMQEARILDDQKTRVLIPQLVADLLEGVAFEARESELIDQKSGVSARLSISGYESLVSACERRGIITGEKVSQARISDLASIAQAVTGKVELVYEGEQEGPEGVALRLVGQSIRTKFPQIFPDPDTFKRKKIPGPYDQITSWFDSNELELSLDDSTSELKDALGKVPGLEALVIKYMPDVAEDELHLYMEFVLHGLAEYSLISKSVMSHVISFSDMLNTIFSSDEDYE